MPAEEIQVDCGKEMERVRQRRRGGPRDHGVMTEWGRERTGGWEVAVERERGREKERA